MKRFDFMLQWYHKENERTHNLTTSLNIPIGILTALAAIFYFLLTQFDFLPPRPLSFIFISLISLSILLWFVSAFNVFRNSYNQHQRTEINHKADRYV